MAAYAYRAGISGLRYDSTTTLGNMTSVLLLENIHDSASRHFADTNVDIERRKARSPAPNCGARCSSIN